MDDMPVGTIVCYGGPMTAGVVVNLIGEGWMLCDGSPLDQTTYASLYAVIGIAYGASGTSFNVPNLQGQFLRGTCGTATTASGTPVDPDTDSRTGSGPNGTGNNGNNVGSAQAFATMAPVTPFVSANAGQHTHVVAHLPTTYHNAYAGSIGRNGSNYPGSESNTGSAGAHTHTITSGGDAETRPVNMALYWIIKVEATS